MLPVHVLELNGSYFSGFFLFLFEVCGFILACVRFAFILAQVPWPGGLCLSTFAEEQLCAVYLWNVSGRSKQLNLQHGSLRASAALSGEPQSVAEAKVYLDAFAFLVFKF